MSVKNTFFQAILATAIAFAMCFVYSKVYFTANEIDFSPVASPLHMLAACLIGTLLLAWGNFVALRLIKNKRTAQFIFNLVAGILSFASIISAFAAKLPVDQFDDYALFTFPGLVVPMHFFPVLAHLAVLPLFTNKD